MSGTFTFYWELTLKIRLKVRDRSLEPKFGSSLLSPAFFVTTWLLQSSLYALVPKGEQIADHCNSAM